MKPERVFQVLTAAGLVAGGWLYGDYWKNSRLGLVESQDVAEIRATNMEITAEAESLRDQLALARSVISQGPYPVPEEVLDWVRKDYQMAFLNDPKVKTASTSKIQNVAVNNLRLVQRKRRLEAENEAWELLGLVPPKQSLFGQLVTATSAGIKGIVDLGTQEVWLSEDFDPFDLGDQSVLVRLMAQSLSLQHYPAKGWSSRDEWQAWQAVYVGSAAACASRFLARKEATDADSFDFQDPEPAREEMLNNLPPVIQALSNFPYLSGAEYSRSQLVKARGLWRAMFLNPPEDTATILHPERPRVPKPPPLFDQAIMTDFRSNNLGELGLRIWLEPFTGSAEADTLSQEWRNDRYHLTKTDQETNLVWKIELASETAAASLAAEVKRSILPHLREMQPERLLEIVSKGQLVTLTNTR